MTYNWQQKDWPKFKYDISKLEDLLFQFSERIGHLKGVLNALPETYQTQTMIEVLVTEAIKTSEIEGEFLSRNDVVSSIKNNLGLGRVMVKDKNAEGMANLVTVVRSHFQDSLNKRVLFDWHRMIFSINSNISVGAWRSHIAPMQVVSGRYGNEQIHFEAPPSKEVEKEMDRFIQWFNDTAPGAVNEIKHAPIRCAIAHLYFESIHPFEDGNGRVGRAIAEKALLQSVQYPLLLSLSSVIESNKKEYYDALKLGQKSNEITDWIFSFIHTIINAIDNSTALIDFTLQKVKLFDLFKDKLNSRQVKVLNRMLDEGLKGFEGGMTAKKYMKIAKTSKASATRDIQKLNDLGVFKSKGGGRSISYEIQFKK